MKRRARFTLLMCWVLTGGSSFGQVGSTPEGGAPGQTKPSISDESPALGGPKVDSRANDETLVERDFMGKLKRLDESPEEAALHRVALEPDVKAKVDAVLRERGKIVDRMVRENLELIVNLHNAREAGDRAELRKLLLEVRRKLKPFAARGTLLEELKGALPETAYKRVESLTNEYRRAVIEELTQEAKDRGEEVRPRQLAAREELVTLGQQIRQSYERQFTARFTHFEQVLARLDLRPEQEEAIRAMARKQFEETKGKATPSQNHALFARILGKLDPDQKKKLLQMYSEETPE